MMHSYNKKIAELVIQKAKEWLGTPYRHQASRKGVGCDCLGLLRGVWKEIYDFDVDVPSTYDPDWAEATKKDLFLEEVQKWCGEKKIAERMPGDILLFRWKPNLPIKHAAIMVEPDRFIHSYEGRCVTMSYLVPQWFQRLSAVFVFPERLKG